MATQCSGSGVLIVDDHADLRETLAEILADAGYAVATAANGVEALDYLRTHDPPGAILLDLMMPVMGGGELRQRLKQEPGLAQIPVMVVSGADRIEQQSAMADAVAYFVKPVDVHGMLEAVSHYCARNPQAGRV